ncbi:cyclophilin-like fold protein [Swaminathania salitolerans]|nr:cyclophilin-like fold protein [Swaminathania salitolerans]
MSQTRIMQADPEIPGAGTLARRTVLTAIRGGGVIALTGSGLFSGAMFSGAMFSGAMAATRRDPSPRKVDFMTLEINAEGQRLTASLDDNETARDFAAMLPLALRLTDYGTIEKVSDLPHPLKSEETPAGYSPRRGDIAYYAPWGNLVIFRQDFRHACGLIRLGAIRSDIAALDRSGTIPVTIAQLDRKR